MTGIDEIIDALGARRLPLSDEKALQAEIAAVLVETGMFVLREHRIRGGIIDLLVSAADDVCRTSAIGIEVKIAGGKRAIFRQVARYCEDPSIVALLLVTATAVRLPETIHGKPVRVLQIGRAWL